jgi:hypothetical protein
MTMRAVAAEKAALMRAQIFLCAKYPTDILGNVGAIAVCLSTRRTLLLQGGSYDDPA